MLVLRCLSLCNQSRTPAQEVVLTIFMVGSTTSLNLTLTMPHRSTQGLSTYLNSVRIVGNIIVISQYDSFIGYN